MTQKEAERQGLTFTGMYASRWEEKNIEEHKKEAAELRKIGIRCVQVPDGDGYSWYADPDYIKYESLRLNKHIIDTADQERNRLKEEYEAKLKELDSHIESAKSNIEYMKEKYGEKAIEKIL